MKRGFTMIELIFVIVILGILAAVAIPRLAATRDDAEVSKAATNLTTIMSDIGAYYTSQAAFASSIGQMTNVKVNNEAGSISTTSGKQFGTATGDLQSAGKDCISLELTPYDDSSKKPAFMKVKVNSNKGAICQKIADLPAVKKITTGTFQWEKVVTSSSGKETRTTETSGAGEVAISGIGVVF